MKNIKNSITNIVARIFMYFPEAILGIISNILWALTLGLYKVNFEIKWVAFINGLLKNNNGWLNNWFYGKLYKQENINIFNMTQEDIIKAADILSQRRYEQKYKQQHEQQHEQQYRQGETKPWQKLIDSVQKGRETLSRQDDYCVKKPVKTTTEIETIKVLELELAKYKEALNHPQGLYNEHRLPVNIDVHYIKNINEIYGTDWGGERERELEIAINDLYYKYKHIDNQKR
jgi:hypothetical protein